MNGNRASKNEIGAMAEARRELDEIVAKLSGFRAGVEADEELSEADKAFLSTLVTRAIITLEQFNN